MRQSAKVSQPLAAYRTVLLDVNGTFMFGHDRLGPDGDFAAAYRRLGGTHLPGSEVTRIVRRVVDVLAQLYCDPQCFECFPRTVEVIAEVAPWLPGADAELIEAIIAEHEVGEVPEVHVRAVRRLARNWRLVLVSNLWSDKDRWLRAFGRAGLDDAFEALVFSSDYRCIKPSPRLFEIALASARANREEAVVVGDDPQRDVVAARRAGIDAIWLTCGRNVEFPPGLQPNACFHDLPALADAL